MTKQQYYGGKLPKTPVMQSCQVRKMCRGNWLKDTLKTKSRKRARKRQEILQTLYDKCYEITDEYDESVGNFIGDNDILCLAKHYGVEVEE